MDRRGFIGAVAVGGSSLFLPQKAKAKAEEQWWQVREFLFEGTTCLEYLWPTDRLIVLERNIFDPKGNEHIIVPTFFLWEIDSDVETQLRKSIASATDTGQPSYVDKKSLVAHLIRVMDDPENHIGIMCNAAKSVPVTNHFRHSAYHAINRMKRRRERVKRISKDEALKHE